MLSSERFESIRKAVLSELLNKHDALDRSREFIINVTVKPEPLPLNSSRFLAKYVVYAHKRLYYMPDNYPPGWFWKLNVCYNNDGTIKVSGVLSLSNKRKVYGPELEKLHNLISDLQEFLDNNRRNDIRIMMQYFGDEWFDRTSPVLDDWVVSAPLIRTEFIPGNLYKQADLLGYGCNEDEETSLREARVFLVHDFLGRKFTLDIWSSEARFLNGDNSQCFIDIIKATQDVSDTFSRYLPTTFARKVKVNRTKLKRQ
jgi:hypothetical protein